MRESRTCGSVRGARDETRVPTAPTAPVHQTARLGLDVPPMVLARADEVIEGGAASSSRCWAVRRSRMQPLILTLSVENTAEPCLDIRAHQTPRSRPAVDARPVAIASVGR